MHYRNRAEHLFDDIRSNQLHVGALARDFLNFWRTKFPYMLTVAWLTSIDMDMFLVASFREFFPLEHGHYISFKNHTALGVMRQPPQPEELEEPEEAEEAEEPEGW